MQSRCLVGEMPHACKRYSTMDLTDENGRLLAIMRVAIEFQGQLTMTIWKPFIQQAVLLLVSGYLFAYSLSLYYVGNRRSEPTIVKVKHLLHKLRNTAEYVLSVIHLHASIIPAVR
ncbi:hypothetical protein BKA56DRAFT_615502 [Ilyonectria sp. MPI-CAGE-AT-0026]|nr:hypothetical protein BKA56DRAFT_615502 [Ilyonectria sp. MPI-CAGE-AT-0026]